MFFGRKEELKEIRDGLNTDRFEGFLIYGRRRVGKTELINEAIKDTNKLVVSYECIKSTIDANLNLFTNKLKKIFGDEYIHFDNFDGLFDYVFKKSLEQEIIFIIDEFSFLLNEDFSIESSLAVAIDKYKYSNIKLFISGSYVTLMQQMIAYESHSYGRFTHILIIRPFDYFDSAKFYPSYSDEEKIMMYSVFGGIPFFNSLIDTKKTAVENIIDLVVKKDSIIEHEINEMILVETNKISNMNYVITLMSKGMKKYKDIGDSLSKVGVTKPDYLLKKLIDMDIAKKVFPINDENNKKRIMYLFKDNLLNFYYRYIFYTPYQEFRAEPGLFFDKFIKESFYSEYLPKRFEMIAQEFLIKKNLNKELKPFIFKIGNYSYDDPQKRINREFDVVTLDERGYISYECKYTNMPIDNNIIAKEIKQTTDAEIGFYKLGFISKNGFSNDVDKNKYNCFSLEDFYKFK